MSSLATGYGISNMANIPKPWRYRRKKILPAVNKISHHRRRLQILELATREWGLRCNAQYCKALTHEPDMKWLVKRGLVELIRKRHLGWGSKPYTGFTHAFITEEGKKFLEKSKKSS